MESKTRKVMIIGILIFIIALIVALAISLPITLRNRDEKSNNSTRNSSNNATSTTVASNMTITTESMRTKTTTIKVSTTTTNELDGIIPLLAIESPTSLDIHMPLLKKPFLMDSSAVQAKVKVDNKKSMPGSNAISSKT